MASRCRSQQSDNESEVSDLEYDAPVGGGEKRAPAFECGGRRTDGTVKPDDNGVRPELCQNTDVEVDQSPMTRCLLHDNFRRDGAKRSRQPSTPDAWARQCRGRAERSDVVNIEAAYFSHLDPSDFGPVGNQHRTSWRDGATDSMTSCMLGSGEKPGLDVRRMEMVAVRDAEFETGNGLVHVPNERVDVECIVDMYCDGETGLPHQIDVPLIDLNATANVPQRSPTYPLLEKLVSPLEKKEKEYQDIESMFLGGLGSISSGAVIAGIFRDASPRGQERLQAFEKLADLTRKARGNANERFAWHGTSKTGVSGIFLHGFGQPRTAKNGSAYGVGVYLAPEGLSRVSAVYADNDENGEQHVVLCRVILGASELIAYGSDQFHPSSEQFDTGVDNLANPKRLIVWSTHMNTHILPLYVVSFKLPPRWHQMMAAHTGKTVHSVDPGASIKRFFTARQKCQEANNDLGTGSFCKGGPTSPFISFPRLFLLLSPLLPPGRLQYLKNCHREFQAKRLTRPQLIQQLRNEVGDHRLLHAIKLLQGSQMSKGQEQIKYESSISFPAREKIWCETPLSFTLLEKSKCESPLSFTAVSLSSTDSVANVQARTVYKTR